MRPIREIIIHCAATPPNMDIGATEIDRWHRQRGFKGIGYHFVIRRSGVLEQGRPLERIGAHAKGHNRYSIGICWVGGLDKNGKPADNRTDAQRTTLETLVKALHSIYPYARILGHRDLPGVNKACPCFDVDRWLYEIGIQN